MARRFEKNGTISGQYRRYNALGTQLTARLKPPSNNRDLVGHFLASVNVLFEYTLQDMSDSDMVGKTIQNQVNQNDKPIGISFRRKDQLEADVIRSVFETVSQSNSRFNALDTLVVIVHSIKMPVRFGRGIMSTGRTVSLIAHLKSCIGEIKAANNCLAHALIVAIAKVDNDANYTAYRKVRKIRPILQTLPQETGIDLTSAAGITELIRSKDIFGTTR